MAEALYQKQATGTKRANPLPAKLGKVAGEAGRMGWRRTKRNDALGSDAARGIMRIMYIAGALQAALGGTKLVTIGAKHFATAWDALGRSSQDVAHLKARAELMIALTDHIAKQVWTQSEAAGRLGVTQPRVSDLTRGKFSAFGLDHLVAMLARAGMTVDIRVRKRAA